jgi:hypothetical protein
MVDDTFAILSGYCTYDARKMCAMAIQCFALLPFRDAFVPSKVCSASAIGNAGGIFKKRSGVFGAYGHTYFVVSLYLSF